MLLGDFDNGTTANNALGATDSDIADEVDLSAGEIRAGLRFTAVRSLAFTI